MSSAPGEVVPRCYRHPHREALIRCTRCDRPICPDCMRPASVGFHCPDDVERGAKTTRPPRTSVGAALLQRPPYVTGTLIALNVVAYVITGTSSGGTLRNPTRGASDPDSLFYKWQLQPYAVHRFHRYYELITSAFLHVSLLHIASNMITLLFVGPALEQLLGWWRFLALYLIAALGGSAVIYAFGSSLGTTVGASGAIFGLFGACLVLVRRLGLDAQWLVGLIVLNFVLTFSIQNISRLGHIGGFLTGVLAAVAIAGLPARRVRLATGVQVAGLGGVLVLVALVVGLRTATW
jgi:membrane associated rhomboid family serine protease